MAKSDRVGELERLGQLLAQGVLSQDEFETEKRRWLAADTKKKPKHSRQQIRLIGVLVLAGVLIAGIVWFGLREPQFAATSRADGGDLHTNSQTAIVPGNKSDDTPLQETTLTNTPPLLGRCHMDFCGYSREVRRETIKESSSGRLLKVTLIWGEANYTGHEGYDDSQPIVWEREPDDVFVFCSTSLPAVMVTVTEQRNLQIDVLAFDENGVPGALQSSANLYMNVCHGIRDRDWTSDLKRLGYRLASEDLQDAEITIERPEEIFNFVH